MYFEIIKVNQRVEKIFRILEIQTKEKGVCLTLKIAIPRHGVDLSRRCVRTSNSQDLKFSDKDFLFWSLFLRKRKLTKGKESFMQNIV